MKECNKCGRMLPISMFAKNRNTKDKYQTHCRDCMKVYDTARKERNIK